MAWSDGKTWSANETIDAAEMNTELRDRLNYLREDKPRVQVYLDNDFAPSGLQAIPWEAESYDNDSMWASSPNPTRITFTTAGIYWVYHQVTVDDTLTTWTAECETRLNGATKIDWSGKEESNTASNEGTLRSGILYRMAASDYVEIMLQITGTLADAQGGGARFTHAGAYMVQGV